MAVAATYVPSLGTVQRWFLRRRALASGIAVSGIGAAMVIGPGISNALIAAFGWRMALLLTGIGAAGLVALGGALLVRSPAGAGLMPDGDPPAPSNPAAPWASAQADRSPGAAVRSVEFRWLYAAMLLMCIPLTMGHGHIVAFGRDAGLDPALAALGLQAMGAGSIVGRLALAPLADQIGRRRAYALMTALLAVVMLTWLVLPAAIVPLLVLFGLVFGTAQGGFIALSPAVVADYFGTRFVAAIIGIVYTAAGLGSLIGPWVAGAIYDATGSYQSAIVVGAACAGLATLALFRIRPAGATRAVPESLQRPAPPSATPLAPPGTAAG